MSLFDTYHPRTFGDFVGSTTRQKALELVADRLAKGRTEMSNRTGAYMRFKPLYVAVIGGPRTGTSSLLHLLGKAHACTSGIDGGPCGVCETCLQFERLRWESHISMQIGGNMTMDNPSILPSRTPATAIADIKFRDGSSPGWNGYSFARFPLVHDNIDTLRDISAALLGQRIDLPENLDRHHAEVVLFEGIGLSTRTKRRRRITATQAPLRRPRRILTRNNDVQPEDETTNVQRELAILLDDPSLASAIFSVNEADWDRMEPRLKSQLTPLEIIKPEFGEVLALAKRVANDEALYLEPRSSLEELVDAGGGIVGNVLRIMDLAKRENRLITSDWIRQIAAFYV